MEFIFQYPIWFILFCLLLGFIYSLVLYFKTNHFTDATPNFHLVKWGMAILRFLSVSVLSFLLLSPLVKSSFVDKVDPTVLIVHDNSASIKLSFSNLDSSQYIKDLKALRAAYSEKFDLDFYSFSDKAYLQDSLTFLEKRTNISNTLEQINGNYFNRNIGAVILASDGIYNEGNNPLYSDFNFPIYAIALGDTNIQKDLKIAQINANRIAYLDDKVQVDVFVEAYNAAKESLQVELYNANGKRIAVEKISIEKPYQEEKLSFVVKATKVDILKYTIAVNKIKNEISYENNSSSFYLEVIDSRQKVLILANAPHPDVAAIKQSISKNKNLEIDLAYITKMDKDLDAYNLVVLHNLPSEKNKSQAIFKELKKQNIPFLMVAGLVSDFTKINDFQSVVNIKPSASNLNEVSLYSNENFTSFNISNETQQKLKKFTPISVPFGDYKLAAGSKVLFYQKIGAVETDYPIIAFNESLGFKSGIIVGEGIWRWRLHDFLEHQNHEAFDEIFQKMINYLAIKSDKRKFRVSSPKNIFFETEPVQIEAELYNESYELVNEPEIELLVKNDLGEEFPLSMSRKNNIYVLSTSNLAIGSYSYEAKTSYAGKIYKASGLFSIKALQLEAIQTRANHKILNQLASKTNGAVFYPNELDKLQSLVLSKEDIKPILHQTYKTKSIINLKWIFFLILGLLSIEWFARKYFGGY